MYTERPLHETQLRVEGEHGVLVAPDEQEGGHVAGHHLQPRHVQRRGSLAASRNRHSPETTKTFTQTET